MQSSSQFRRSGPRDDRRRRLLTDVLGLGLWGGGRPVARRYVAGWNASAAPLRSENYGDGQFMDEQARLTDLVPRRLGMFALLLLLGLGAIAGLEALYAWMPQLAAHTTDGRIAAFDLDGEGSLAVWFSSTTLSLAGLLAVLVFNVRRWRLDDYQGRYRIWLWAAMCWFMMSLDETASLHEGFKEMMTMLTGTRLMGDGSLWWAIPYFFALTAVGSRLLIDMFECKLSSLAFVVAGACYAAAAAAQLHLVLPDGGAKEVMFEEGAELVGDLFLMLSMGLHARFVILDAEGLIHRRRRKIVVRPMVSSQPMLLVQPDGQSMVQEQPMFVEVDSPHGIPSPVAVSTGLGATIPPTTINTATGSVQRKLTKAERKALRSRLELMRRDRERRSR